MRQAFSLNGERIVVEAIDCASGTPYIALRVRGVRDGQIADLYLNPGHVEQFDKALAEAKAALGVQVRPDMEQER